jgi:hypothetical protein
MRRIAVARRFVPVVLAAAFVVAPLAAGASAPLAEESSVSASAAAAGIAGEGFGRRDAAAEQAAAAFDGVSLGWGLLAAPAAVGDDWASTRQFPGRPH